MNTGLTLDQFKEIIEFAQTYHEFGRYYDEIERAGIKMLYPKLKTIPIKYIDCCYDSRGRDIWSITFRGWGTDRTFVAEQSETPLFDRIMQYLKGEVE